MTASKPVLFLELVDKADDQVVFKITDEGRMILESIGQKLVGSGLISGVCGHHCWTAKNWKVLSC